MIKADKYYIDNLNEILNNGHLDKDPRPKYKDGKAAHTKFITQSFEKYNISKGEFPITTLRNTAIKTGIKEILWIYQKQSSSLELAREMGINWWDEWDIGDGTIGQRYGATIKKYNLIDELLYNLKHNPFSRRHIIDMYQYEDLNSSNGLYPCAYKTSWSVREVNGQMYVDMTLDQRSNDYIMAGYINKIQYVALMLMVCNQLGYKPGIFAHFVQNLHIYDRHIEAANEILNREPIQVQPKIELNVTKDFYDITIDDFSIDNIKGIKKINSPIEIAV